jgi:3',5'-cyclic AMP phosphodiesterase CpdA
MLPDYLHLPDGRYYHSFSHGPVYFICLDSGEDKPDDNRYYFGLADFDRYREEQARWLKEVMATPGFRNAKFRVVLIHMPLYGGNNWHGEETNRRLWGDLLNRGGIDLMISGHTHRYAFHKPGVFANAYPLLIGSPEDGIVIHAAADELSVRVYTVTGEIRENFSIKAQR